MEKIIIETFNSIQKRVEKIDLTEKINSEIEGLMITFDKPRQRLSIFLKTALVSLIVIAAILIFYPYNEITKTQNEKIQIETLQELTLQYVRISGKEAKRYYFKSDNSNRLIVWVQKKGD